MTKSNTEIILDDAAIAEIEARYKLAAKLFPYKQVNDALDDIPALTRDWRALREQLATASKQRDDALVRAAEDQDEHSAQRAALVVQLEQVTKERDDLRDNMNRLARARAREMEREQ